MTGRALRALLMLFLIAFARPSAAQMSQDVLAARQQLDRGVADARNGDFLSAISRFQEAQWKAPLEPAPYYNLALAEAQIPGRELRSICWFSAFLAARPSTPFKEAIIESVEELKNRSRANIAALIMLHQQGAQSGGFSELRNYQAYRDFLLYRSGMLWLHLNQAGQAEKTAALISWNSPRQQRLFANTGRLRELRHDHDTDTIEQALNDGSKLPRTPMYDGRFSDFYVDYENGYWVGYTRISAWTRLFDWFGSLTGRPVVSDPARLSRWADTCNGFALAQPMFTDLPGHLAALSYGLGPSEDWRAMDALLRGVGDAAGEMTYVHNARVSEFSQLLNEIAPSWQLIWQFAFVALLYAAGFVWLFLYGAFEPRPSGPDADPVWIDLGVVPLVGILMLGLLGIALVLYLAGNWMEEHRLASIIVGGFFLACLIVISFLPFVIVLEGGIAAFRRSFSAATQFAIGSRFEAGRDVARNDAKALAWYRKAAKRGHAASQTKLGDFYRHGRGAPADDRSAFKWYLRAAEQGDGHAQNNLGLLYATGRGVALDYSEAMRWFAKAAGQGVVEAQENVGLLFEKGHGVARDIDSAIRWYERAAANGSAKARERLERLK